MTASVRQDLQLALDHRQQVRLERPGMDTEHLHGIPLALGDELVLLRVVDDFRLDGYSVVRIGDVESLRSNEYERFVERVLHDRGLLADVGRVAPVPVDNWASLLAVLRESRTITIVECEAADVEEFYIGRVCTVGVDAVEVLEFSPMAEWEEEPCRIALADITRVRFLDGYSTAFLPYLSEPQVT